MVDRLRLPDFIVIGAAKSATTTLADHLAARSDVYFSKPKEPEFFARDDRYAEGLEGYAKLFNNARSDQLCGEASTIYTLTPHFPDAAQRMAEALPDVRLVYILREPVGRAYSFYAQHVKSYQRHQGRRDVPRSFEEAIDPDAPRGRPEAVFSPHDRHYPDVPGIYLDGSDYIRQIEVYLQHFDRKQIHFALFEELTSDPVTVIAGIHRHIGLPEDGITPPTASNVAETYYQGAAADDIAGRLTEAIPMLKAVTNRLPTGMRQVLKSRTAALLGDGEAGPVRPAPMRPETRAALQARYAPEREKLAALTGLDIDRWWGPV